jgi:diacylglycerol kinase (ATP)
VKLLFIVNPTAGGGRGLRTWRVIEQAMSARGMPAEVRFTGRRGAATEFAVQGRQAGFETIVGVGGDGTLQEVVNGLVDTEGRCRAALGVIPGGTGNDFSKLLTYPQDPLGALNVVLAGKERRIDLGRVNGRFFLNIAGIGFDAEVVRSLDLKPKRLPGATTYVLGVLRTIVNYTPTYLTIEFEGVTIRQKCLLVSVANGPAHGGGLRMCPGAITDDGLLDLCVAGDFGRLEAALMLPRVLKGRHVTHPKVRMYAGAKKVRVSSDAPVYVHADGELLGPTPAEVEIVPGALRVIWPG